MKWATLLFLLLAGSVSATEYRVELVGSVWDVEGWFDGTVGIRTPISYSFVWDTAIPWDYDGPFDPPSLAREAYSSVVGYPTTMTIGDYTTIANATTSEFLAKTCGDLTAGILDSLHESMSGGFVQSN